MIYTFNYGYTDDRIRFFLENDKEGPIYTDEYIDFKNFGKEKLKYLDEIIDDKLNKLINTCKLIVPNLKIDNQDKENVKIETIKIIQEKVNKNLDNLKEKITKLNILIKDWYVKSYPSDEVGLTLSPTVTFLDLNNLLNSGKGRDTYELLGGDADTVIRERCFEKLAELTDRNYKDISDLWLKKEEPEEEMEK